MGVRIYYYMVIAVLAFGLIMPQQGRRKKHYIVLMAVLHAFVCGFRYMYLTGDLRKYAWSYYQSVNQNWNSEEIIQGGRNVGFSLLNKLFAGMTHGDFQIFLVFIAVVIEIAVAMLVFRYSPKPWISYFVWNCLSFYIFGFSSIKQSLAMAILMWAVTGIFERRPKKFLLFTILVGLVHMPALVFLPAYWIARRRVTGDMIWFTAITAVVIYFLRERIIAIVSPLYYENETFVLNEAGLGMRFFFMIGLLAVGMIVKGFEDRDFTVMFHLMVISAILQMFSGFDNVFTRMADYYFQFSVLYIPVMLYDMEDSRRLFKRENYGGAALSRMKPGTRKIAVAVTVALLMLYYYKTQLSANISYDVDNYLNFRFMWEVVQ